MRNGISFSPTGVIASLPVTVPCSLRSPDAAQGQRGVRAEGEQQQLCRARALWGGALRGKGAAPCVSAA